MSFTQAIGSGFKRYVDFSGRSSRSEYWWWYLFVFIGAFVSIVLDALMGTTPVLYLILIAAVILPQLAVTVRRLHDLDKSAWGLLIGLIPFIGAIVLLVWLVSSGDEGNNRYGANPLRAQVPDASGVYVGHVQGF